MKKSGLILFLVALVVCFAMPAAAQEPAKTAPAAAAPVETAEEETDIIAGKVVTVDAANSALTVTDEAGKSYTLTATKEETSIWKGDNTIELAEVKMDDAIELEYYKNKDGKMVAIWIDVLAKEAAAPAEVTPAAPAAEEAQPEMPVEPAE